MASLILPCAGLSTRYTDLKPKFLIENPKMGNLSMVVSSVKGLPLNKFSKIYVVIRDEHEEKFNASKKILEDFLSIGFKNVEVTVIAESKSAADTVSQCININDIEVDIYIKDCDDYFEIDDIQPNEVCTISLHDCGKIHAGNKSYVSINHLDLISTIVEKQVISPNFCCGLYSFGDASQFIRTHNALRNFNKQEEIYISHIIYRLLLEGEKFKIKRAENFVDWGTQEDWNDYTGNTNINLL